MKIELMSRMSPNVHSTSFIPLFNENKWKTTGIATKITIYSHISNHRIHKGKYFLSMICPPSKVYNRNVFSYIFFLLVWFVQEDNLSKLSNVEKLIRTFKCHDGKIDYICSRWWKAIYLCNYTDHKFIFS